MTRLSICRLLPALPNMDIIKVIILIASICIFSLSSCSADWHIKKAIAKDPTILNVPEVHVVDTTIIIREISTDGTFVSLPIDTITIEKERLRIEIKRIHDTLIVQGQCKADTIRVVELVELPPVIKYAPRPKWQKMLGWLLLGLAILKVGQRLLDRFLNV